jgi:tetratricopeptide (TPR) repeat protein
LIDTERDFLSEALKHLGRGDHEAAQPLLAQAAQAHPGDPRPLLLLAAEFVHAKDLDRAEAAYTAALQRAPDFAIARFQLGLLQLTSARPAAAQATWAPLDQLDETHPLRLFKTGLELMAQDQFEQARRWLLAGIAHNKDNPPLNRDMQMVLDRIEELHPTGTDPRGATAAAPPQDGASEGEATPRESADHFLVSAYRKLH